MNNIYKLIIFFPIFIIGCTTNVIKENKILKKIDSLNMNIFANTGEKIYSITSPNSTYNKIKLEFNLKKTTISIFDGKIIKPSGKIYTNCVYIIMEYATGGILFDFCQNNGAMGEEIGKVLFNQILDALEYL